MHPLLGLGLLLAAGIAVTHVSLPAGSWLRRPTAGAFRTIALPVAAGIVLGPGLRILDAAALRGLTPLTALAIGWIGAALGARLSAARLRDVPRHEWAAAAAVAAVTFVASALTALLFVRLVPALHDAWRPTLPALVTLGAIGTMSAVARLGPARRVSAMALLLGIVAFALMIAFYRSGGFAPARGAVRLLAMLALGGGLGVLAVWLARLREDDSPHLAPRLEIVAVILIASGLGVATRLSPFLICLVAGAVLADVARRSTSRSVAQARRTLLRWEPVAAGLMLLLAGALLHLPWASWWLLPAALALGVARVGSRWILVREARRWPPIGRLSMGAARALVGVEQGALVIALALSHELAFGRPPGAGDAMGSAILATALAGALLAQAAARALAGTSFARPLTAAAPRAEVT